MITAENKKLPAATLSDNEEIRMALEEQALMYETEFSPDYMIE